jgi:hypothetical protein
MLRYSHIGRYISLYMPNFVQFPSTFQHLFWGRWNIHNYKVRALKLLFFDLGNLKLITTIFSFFMTWQNNFFMPFTNSVFFDHCENILYHV